MSEVWRPVVGFEGYYEVSDQGRVRSLDRVIANKDARVPGGVRSKTLKGRDINPCKNSAGYDRVALAKDNVKKRVLVSHLVLIAFVGPRPIGSDALHGPLGHTVNTTDNLRWGTKSENQLDRARDGTSLRGVNHPNAKLTPELVTSIRSEIADSRTNIEIAAEFYVSRQAVNSIRTRRTWGWL